MLLLFKFVDQDEKGETARQQVCDKEQSVNLPLPRWPCVTNYVVKLFNVKFNYLNTTFLMLSYSYSILYRIIYFEQGYNMYGVKAIR